MVRVVSDPNMLVCELKKPKEKGWRKSRCAEIEADAAIIAVEKLREQLHARAGL